MTSTEDTFIWSRISSDMRLIDTGSDLYDRTQLYIGKYGFKEMRKNKIEVLNYDLSVQSAWSMALHLLDNIQASKISGTEPNAWLVTLRNTLMGQFGLKPGIGLGKFLLVSEMKQGEVVGLDEEMYPLIQILLFWRDEDTAPLVGYERRYWGKNTEFNPKIDSCLRSLLYVLGMMFYGEGSTIRTITDSMLTGAKDWVEWNEFFRENVPMGLTSTPIERQINELYTMIEGLPDVPLNLMYNVARKVFEKSKKAIQNNQLLSAHVIPEAVIDKFSQDEDSGNHTEDDRETLIAVFRDLAQSSEEEMGEEWKTNSMSMFERAVSMTKPKDSLSCVWIVYNSLHLVFTETLAGVNGDNYVDSFFSKAESLQGSVDNIMEVAEEITINMGSRKKANPFTGNVDVLSQFHSSQQKYTKIPAKADYGELFDSTVNKKPFSKPALLKTFNKLLQKAFPDNQKYAVRAWNSYKHGGIPAGDEALLDADDAYIVLGLSPTHGLFGQFFYSDEETVVVARVHRKVSLAEDLKPPNFLDKRSISLVVVKGTLDDKQSREIVGSLKALFFKPEDVITQTSTHHLLFITEGLSEDSVKRYAYVYAFWWIDYLTTGYKIEQYAAIAELVGKKNIGPWIVFDYFTDVILALKTELNIKERLLTSDEITIDE